METTEIRNFTQTQRVYVSGSIHNEHIGKLVSVNAYEGPCSFMFSMKPEQAREMAEALIAHADALEAA